MHLDDVDGEAVMDKRALGRTGLEVSVIGFGAMTIGGAFGPVDDDESNRALHAAIDAGMNFIDTSDAYGRGRSENVIGRFLKERPDRDDILVLTKGGNNMSTGKTDFTPRYIADALEGSLQRLGVTPALYMLHNPKEDNLAAEDSYALLEKAKEDGKIANWGVSVNTVAECDLAVAQGKPSVIQMEYNTLRQEAALSVTRANAAGVGVIARMPLKRGFLSGSIDESSEFAEGDRRKTMFSPENIRKLKGKLDELRDEADKLGISPAAAAIRFCVSNRDVSCVLPGIRTAEQSILNSSYGQPLPIEVVRRLQD
jgi:aryl-alcohol dehydrogenase-like predicted oxidoreductase